MVELTPKQRDLLYDLKSKKFELQQLRAKQDDLLSAVKVNYNRIKRLKADLSILVDELGGF